MSEIPDIQNQVRELLAQDTPPLIELRKALLEIEELVAAEDYSDLSADEQEQLQVMRRDLKARLRQIEDLQAMSAQIEPGAEAASAAQPGAADETRQLPAKSHNPEAERQMEEAERLFYGGRYSEAIKLFDRVLQLEPAWERARQHRAESENYLRTGYIPPVALPPEAASAFGKAQSAARVGRFTDALNMLARAQSTLRELGIQRWQEGLEFEQKLQENIDAETAYNEGLQLFEDGRLDEAIERVDTAARATGLPKYSDRGGAFRRVKETLRSINEALSAPDIEPKMVTQAKADLDALTGEYGENPAFLKQKSRLEATIPRAIAPLQESARLLKSQAERAVTLDEALYLARQARAQLDQIRNLASLDDSLDHLQNEIEKIIHDVSRYQDELSQAAAAYENHRRWPVQAARLSQEARQKFPNDPGVIRLNRSLAGHFFALTLLKIGGVVIGIVFVALVGYLGIGRFQSYLLSLTPTATPTLTMTATLTPSATPTLTPTDTPTPTLTFTPTPTPFIGVALRDIWARSGCYEGFNAIGRIPIGGNLRFLPDERRFDTFNRECVLVEYRGEERSIIGWVLIADVGSAPSTPAP
ncbi:MAG: hypothetical protein B6D39_09385 [Anaerolineae bacterium UTCFX2]|nr:MAG: hypothetical protein B6D39_09385 [Anaerolineae bacterium UTCFX2]